MHLLINLIVLLLILTLFSACAKKNTLGKDTPPLGRILESGICEEGRTESRYSQPQSTAGYASFTDLRISEKTNVIPLRKGIGFGYSWEASGLPQSVIITYLVEHPSITRPDGKTLNHFEEDLSKETNGGTLTTTDCYFLSEDHEVVPGVWTISILYKGTVLARQSYLVKAVNLSPNPT